MSEDDIIEARTAFELCKHDLYGQHADALDAFVDERRAIDSKGAPDPSGASR